MIQFTVFIKKEFMEIAKSYKIIVFPALFIILGLMSPLSAKFINDIIKSLGGGLNIVLPKPQYIDAYVQFFKNMGQLGIIILILTFMSGVVEEKSSGSAVLVLTKGLSRGSFITAKYISYSVYFTAAYTISSLACVYYTVLLFPDSPLNKVIGGFLLMWLFGLFVIAFTLFFSTIAKNTTATAVYSIVFFFLLSIISSLPKIGKYLPSYLTSAPVNYIGGSLAWGDLYAVLFITIVSIAVLLVLAVQIFKRQEV